MGGGVIIRLVIRGGKNVPGTEERDSPRVDWRVSRHFWTHQEGLLYVPQPWSVVALILSEVLRS